MSRIGNKHIDLPAGVTVSEDNGFAVVKGPKGELKVKLNKGIQMNVEGTVVTFKRENETKQVKQNHGTVRANVHNAIVGVSEGYKKTLEMRGIGYKAQMKGQAVEIWAGYSHTVVINPEQGVKITLPNATDIEVEVVDPTAMCSVKRVGIGFVVINPISSRILQMLFHITHQYVGIHIV